MRHGILQPNSIGIGKNNTIPAFREKFGDRKLKRYHGEPLRGKSNWGHERRVELAFVDISVYGGDTSLIECFRRKPISSNYKKIFQAEPQHRIDPIGSSLDIFFRNESEI